MFKFKLNKGWGVCAPITVQLRFILLATHSHHVNAINSVCYTGSRLLQHGLHPLRVLAWFKIALMR